MNTNILFLMVVFLFVSKNIFGDVRSQNAKKFFIEGLCKENALKSEKKFYRWGQKAFEQSNIDAKKVTPENERYASQIKFGAFGPGIYLSDSPTLTVQYTGVLAPQTTLLSEYAIPPGTPFLDLTDEKVRSKLKEKGISWKDDTKNIPCLFKVQNLKGHSYFLLRTTKNVKVGNYKGQNAINDFEIVMGKRNAYKKKFYYNVDSEDEESKSESSDDSECQRPEPPFDLALQGLKSFLVYQHGEKIASITSKSLRFSLEGGLCYLIEPSKDEKHSEKKTPARFEDCTQNLPTICLLDTDASSLKYRLVNRYQLGKKFSGMSNIGFHSHEECMHFNRPINQAKGLICLPDSSIFSAPGFKIYDVYSSRPMSGTTHHLLKDCQASLNLASRSLSGPFLCLEVKNGVGLFNRDRGDQVTNIIFPDMKSCTENFRDIMGDWGCFRASNGNYQFKEIPGKALINRKKFNTREDCQKYLRISTNRTDSRRAKEEQQIEYEQMFKNEKSVKEKPKFLSQIGITISQISRGFYRGIGQGMGKVQRFFSKNARTKYSNQQSQNRFDERYARRLQQEEFTRHFHKSGPQSNNQNSQDFFDESSEDASVDVSEGREGHPPNDYPEIERMIDIEDFMEQPLLVKELMLPVLGADYQKRINAMRSGSCPLSFSSQEQYSHFNSELGEVLKEVEKDILNEMPTLKEEFHQVKGTVFLEGTSTKFISGNPHKGIKLKNVVKDFRLFPKYKNELHYFDKKVIEAGGESAVSQLPFKKQLKIRADNDLHISSDIIATYFQKKHAQSFSTQVGVYFANETTRLIPKLKVFKEKWENILGREINFNVYKNGSSTKYGLRKLPFQFDYNE